MAEIEGQMELPLSWEPTPGECAWEGAVADIGGGKSYCIPWGRWTNCREVGHCVMDSTEGMDDGKCLQIPEERP